MSEQIQPLDDNLDDQLLAVPEETFAAIDADCQEMGGEFNPPEVAGSIGRTMFDSQAQRGWHGHDLAPPRKPG